MRGTVAKRLRKKIYGTEFSPLSRNYYYVDRNSRTVVCLGKRREYQELKRKHKT